MRKCVWIHIEGWKVWFNVETWWQSIIRSAHSKSHQESMFGKHSLTQHKFRNQKMIYMFGGQWQATKWNFISNLHFAFPLRLSVDIVHCAPTHTAGTLVKPFRQLLPLCRTQNARYISIFSLTRRRLHIDVAPKKRSNFPARKAKNLSRWMSIRTDCCCGSHRRQGKKHRNREHLMYPTAIKLNHPK